MPSSGTKPLTTACATATAAGPWTTSLKPAPNGRRLQIIPVTDETTQINLSQYANGIYFVKLVDDGNVVSVGKVVKE